ncbi:sperm-egg fusion protein TMEM95 isoform X2 [Panthera onca]|uniref:sperm-egg fusion protein TMEM95 isoform X2 n=1 Tax=Panthera onca TaxID=9690 RepID=UPI0029543564|nr:sperm-egg fusion protein TMEM95 isoform X2 [Panthera onca]
MGPASLCHPLAGLMWTLALGGVFLATAQACVLCHLSDRDLPGRLARLCNQVEARWETCEASWTFPAFALDEVSTNKVIEKTHRVLRVMEIKGSPSSLPLYWQWLQKVKFPEYTREAFCAPACRLCRALLASKALPPRKSRSSGSQDSAPLCVHNCPAPGRSEPRGGVQTLQSKK